MAEVQVQWVAWFDFIAVILFLKQNDMRKREQIIKRRACVLLECLAPHALSWPSYSDIPCGECARSGCSDCWAIRTGAVTERLEGPSPSDTCCDNMTQSFSTVTTDVGSIQEMESECMIGHTWLLCLELAQDTNEPQECQPLTLITDWSPYILFCKISSRYTHALLATHHIFNTS